MKFAKTTLSLLAVALLAAAPNSAFAGNGLLDGGCGCATQKGGIAQKGYVHQKGEIIQKGGVSQKGDIIQKGGPIQKGGIAQKGCATQKGCGSSKGGGCGSCSTCLPPILPTLLNGIDSLLNAVFCCDSCGSSKGGCGCATQKGGIAQKGGIFQKGHVTQKGGSCNCGESHSGPSNPFIDDLQPPPVLDPNGDARIRIRREVTRPVSQGTPSSTRSVIKTASSTSREPRPLPAELVSPLDQIRQPRTTTQPTPAAVIRTSATTTSGLVVPANPLR